MSGIAAVKDDTVGVPSKQGWLYKKGLRHTGWKRRYFILRGETLLYYNQPAESQAKGDIPLTNCSVTYGKESTRNKNKFAFDIRPASISRIYHIYADTAAERESWISKIKLAAVYKAAQEGAKENEVKQAGIQSGVHAGKLKTPLNLSLGADYLSAIEVKPKFSQWRSPLSLQGLSTRTREMVSVTEMRPDDQIDMASAFAVHNSYNAIACGNYAGANSVMQIVRVPATRADFVVMAKFRQSNSCIDLSWIEEKLLCSSLNGHVFLYNCNPGALLQPGALGSSGDNVLAATFKHTDVAELGTTGSGPVDANSYAVSAGLGLGSNMPLPQYRLNSSQRMASSRVRRVAINPVNRKTFLSIANEHLYIWDMERSDKPDVSEKISQGNLFAAAWSPHAETELVVAGERRAIKLYDSRLFGKKDSKSVPWKVSGAHDASIRDIAWSPLVPYWLASVGDDACLRIWDTRFGHKSVRTLTGHTNAVLRVAWSRARPDELLTGGADCSLRLWNLRTAPHYLLLAQDGFSGSLVGCGFSSTNSLQCYGLSVMGELLSLQIKPDLLTEYAIHRALPESASLLSPRAGPASAVQSPPVLAHYPSSPSPLLNGPSTPITIGHGSTALKPENDIGTMTPNPFEEKGMKLSSSPDNETKENPPVNVAKMFAAVYESSGNADSLKVSSPDRPVQKHMRQVVQKAVQRQHEIEQESQEFKDIESQVYIRDMASAFARIAQLAAKFLERQQHERASALLKLCSPNNFTSCADNPGKSFTKLLHDLSYFMPGACLLMTKADERDRRTIQLLKLRLALSHYIEEGQYKEIFALESQILEHLSSNAEAFSGNFLESIVTTTLPFDYIRSLDLALRIGKILKEGGHFGNFVRIARILFFPTIYHATDESLALPPPSLPEQTPISNPVMSPAPFLRSDTVTSVRTTAISAMVGSAPMELKYASPDPATASPLPNPAAPFPPSHTPSVSGSAENSQFIKDAKMSLDRDYRNPKIVLAQLELLIQIHVALQAPDASLAVLELMDDRKEQRKILPQIIHRIYFNALLLQRRYDIFYIVATRLATSLRHYEFCKIVDHLLETITFSRFQRFLESLLGREGRGPREPTKKTAAALTIINILYNADYLPRSLQTHLPGYLSRISEELRLSLKELPKSSTEAVPAVKDDAKIRAEKILQQIQRLREYQRAKQPMFEDWIQKLCAMLQQFAGASSEHSSVQGSPAVSANVSPRLSDKNSSVEASTTSP